MTDKMATETVYGTNEESHVMSEKVQSLAATVYKEFEKVIKRYDEDVVKDLMPLVVGILESLDAAFTEKQELDVEIELLREDNEQLLTQYEREKQLRKGAEQKFLEMEDNIEGVKKELVDKVETLESIIRMSEIKSKNTADHVTRLEEKEQEQKNEYNKLHERYTELFRTHMDYMERTKILMGTDKLSDLTGMTARANKGLNLPGLRPISVAYGGIMEFHNRHESSPMSFDTGTPHSAANVSLKSELDAQTPKKIESLDKEQLTDSINVTEQATATKHSKQVVLVSPASISEPKPSHTQDTEGYVESVIDTNSTSHVLKANESNIESPLPVIMRRHKSELEEDNSFDYTLSLEDYHMSVATTPELEESQDIIASQGTLSKRKSGRNDNSIFDEFSEQDANIAEVDFGADITDSDEHEENEEEKEDEENDKDSVGDNFFGIGKELENLISENSELLATKNALNIVKDDLIAKVDELSSEQEILREEINSLQAVKGRLQLRIAQLEEELKKVREENDKRDKEHTEKGEEEDDVPMAQRKRFTRVEMARVLMERNQYKERLMELQEAVRWTEMIRASREHPGELQTKKKSSVWNFFGSLFTSSNKPKRSPVATVKYNAPTTHVQPVGDPNKKSRDKGTSNPKSKAYDFLQEDIISEKSKKERERDRKEQYKQVRAHVKKDDGRMQAYGWSLPTKFISHTPKDTSGKSQVPVPVPVYCRPLFDNQTGWKIWCAAGVNLTGGKTRDGGSIVGASVFYSDPPPEEKKEAEVKTEVDKLDKELKDHTKAVKDIETEQMSSLVWVCTSTNDASRVSVIDANNPADVLETFRVSVTHILCIASIPGAMESDYPVAEEILNAEAQDLPKETVVSAGTSPGSGDSSGLGGVTFVQCATGGTSPVSGSPVGSVTDNRSDDLSIKVEDSDSVKDEGEKTGGEAGDPLGAAGVSDVPQTQIFKARGSPASSGSNTPTHTARLKVTGSSADLVNDGRSSPISDHDLQNEEADKMSSVLPTMWMGSHSGSMYVHSSVSNWKRCLHSVKLRDSILGIVHVKGRVLVSLADGTVAIFHRASDGQWDLRNYHLIDLGKPKQSIRCMTVVAGQHVWCGYKNKVHIIDPQSMSIEKSFDAHPRKESQVRQLCWVGDGVWVSIRLDSTLRLYHAYTHQHLQDVDIEPYVSKMLGTGKLGFSLVRITTLLISCNRLWIGTGNGVIISVPLSESNKQPMITTSSSLSGLSGGSGRPGGVVRVYSDPKTESVTPGSFIPYCSMAQAQLSFHGHKDAVKFFVSVPVYARRFGELTVSETFLEEARRRKSPIYEEGIQRQGMSAASDPVPSTSSTPPPRGEATPAPASNTRLILSGGEGYVDFRQGDGDEEDPTAAAAMVNDEDDEDPSKASSLTKVDRSHIIVWQDSVTEPHGL
ncbi:C-Jun-amino-terminal kinase-interacting protein 4-like isoform X5 [Physella acuta]|uniref:C-Jun-amino-terminal kinase-interacting protein 4-like isoform X5 n=1 Tax=Physella acuta TaxID=109671 RepID=UPI0027DB034B|nr:C-Jun-amino-terminal kinase-interacting protein 4-like isoform X5 [Physella acuta]